MKLSESLLKRNNLVMRKTEIPSLIKVHYEGLVMSDVLLFSLVSYKVERVLKCFLSVRDGDIERSEIGGHCKVFSRRL